MPFSKSELHNCVRQDNPTYERVLRSDLHDLLALLDSQQAPVWTKDLLDKIATEMKKVPSAKWMKYRKTRAYLETAIPGLKPLLRPRPVDFRTRIMSSQMDDTILRHEFTWKSDTGLLTDLANVYTREKVSWPVWPKAIADCIGLPHGAEYLKAGVHHGLATNPANGGTGKDDHSLLGPFNQTILSYDGPNASAPMDQVYEYSYDRVAWHPIADAGYTIVREVKKVGAKVQLTIRKTNKTKPTDTGAVTKIF